MTFIHPEFFILFVPVIYLFLANVKEKILLLVLAFIVLALGRPVFLSDRKNVQREIREAVIALDLSKSMSATDIKPTRLEVAKDSIADLVTADMFNRYALYAFTTNALILSPVSDDGELILNAMDALNEKNILTRGTSLKTLLQTVIKNQPRIRTLIIFSDGGDDDNLKETLSLAKDAGVKIIGAAVATRRGSLLYDDYGKALKDADGSLVVSRLNPLLKELSIKSGGEFVECRSASGCAKEVLAAIEKIAQKKRLSHKERGFVELFGVPLFIAISLFFFNFVKIPKKILFFIPLFALKSDAFIFDWFYIKEAQKAYSQKSYEKAYDMLGKIGAKSVQKEFDKALTAYRMRKYKKTVGILERLETDDRALMHKIFHLKANACVRLSLYKCARDSYKKALALGYDPDIVSNLRYILGKRDKKELQPPAFKKENNKKTSYDESKDGKKSQNEAQKRSGEKNRKNSHEPKLGYKAYEMINRGYFDEKKPW